MNIDELIRDARTRSKLSVESFAALTRISSDRLKMLEAGEVVTSSQELDAIARVFGVELPDFMAGELGSSQIFFRSMCSDIALDDLLEGGDGLILGDFQRCVGRAARLRTLLGESLPSSSWMDKIEQVPLHDKEPPHIQGEHLAAQARVTLNLGSGPIPSMRSLLSKLGIDVFFLTPGQLQAPLDGACTLHPAPAVLVNPIYEAAPWSLRATMAHELCHLLHDRRGQGLFMISPMTRARTSKRGAQRWQLFDEYLDMEKRANAFAAHFLAPVQSVKAAVAASGCPPASGEAAQLASSTFGVSYETSVNLLWRAYALSHDTRDRLLRLPKDHNSSFDYDELLPSRGLFEGQLRGLALRAYAAGKLGQVEVRRLLEIPMDCELPQSRSVSLTPEQRAPVISHRQRVLKQATRHLMSIDETGYLFATEIAATENGWDVTIHKQEATGEPSEAGMIQLSHDLELRQTQLAS